MTGLSDSALENRSIEDVLAERGEIYGDFADFSIVSQLLKNIVVNKLSQNGKLDTLQPFQAEALGMICHKIARIATGDPYYADSWVDIAGYAKLVADKLES